MNEPWRITKSEYVQSVLDADETLRMARENTPWNTPTVEDMTRGRAEGRHHVAVTMAVVERKPVSKAVLVDYPELQKAAAERLEREAKA